VTVYKKSAFPKDWWIRDALRSGYVVARSDGSVHRAKSVDSEGRVDRSKGFRKIKVQTHRRTGRAYFNMTWRGETKSVLINRIIAIRFHKNPKHLPQVNHIDGDKQNNAVSNLEWVSASDNEKHAHRTGLKSGRGSANSNAKLNAAQVREIRASEAPTASIAQTYGVSRSTIINIKKGVTWTHV
jgi:hypothetical protein